MLLVIAIKTVAILKLKKIFSPTAMLTWGAADQLPCLSHFILLWPLILRQIVSHYVSAYFYIFEISLKKYS